MLSQSNAPSRTITTTVVTESVGLGPGRQQTTQVQTLTITTVVPGDAQPTGNTTNSGSNASATNGNATSASTTTTAKNLPTAPGTVDGGGSGGAPVPGASSPNGAYGPDDKYIAAAMTLAKNALGASLLTSALAGVLFIL